MMKLKDISESFVKEFAGATIFGRGKEYCQNEMVEEIKYDADHIQAEVSGSSMGGYDVEIKGAQRGIEARCGCPYEGYPCKHIVAVLLTFIKKKDLLLKQAVEDKKKMVSLKDRVYALPKDRLAEMLLSLADKHPDCRRDLLVQMGDDPKEAFEAIRKQIHQIFRAFESEECSSSKAARQLEGILRSVNQAQPDLKARVYWAVADRILRELNEYGMDDESLEDIATNALDLLPELLFKSGIFQEEKSGIVRALEKYAKWRNCGITDCLEEALDRIKDG